MNKASHRAFARAPILAQKLDPAIVATLKFKEISADYEALIKLEGHLVESKNLDRMHSKWHKALNRALTTVPTTWSGVVALLNLSLDGQAIGDNADELRSGLRSISAAVRRLLPSGFWPA